ncbi:syntaxin-1A isoform X1 [Parasteatoda tepidariorum]|uniref:syntaxin-1A isoform X1 n=1 Tax=Parasteatoda tepidariorum TaxID=114398 RepID=UPI001C7183A8|nr:syntaxin-1A-like isoform X1 [Parasteatoda tepidariorum]
MAMRNRLAEFHNKSEKPKFISARFEDPIIDENGEFILDYLSKIQEMNGKFNYLDLKISELVRLQSDILEFSQTDAALYPHYDSIKASITELVNKERDMESKFDPQKFTGSETELRIFNTQIMYVKKKLASIITRYYSIQEEYKDKCKAQVRRRAEIAGADLARIDFEEAMGLKTDIFIQTVFPDFDMTLYCLSEIKRRHEDFLKLEKSLAELHEMFFELALVVQVDFTMMDRIDKHSVFVDKLSLSGNREIRGYENQMRSSKFRRYLTVGCIIFVIAIIIMIVLWLFKGYIFGA